MTVQEVTDNSQYVIYRLDNFITHNTWAVIKEVLMLDPLLWIVVLMSARWRGRRRFRRPGTT